MNRKIFEDSNAILDNDCCLKIEKFEKILIDISIKKTSSKFILCLSPQLTELVKLLKNESISLSVSFL